MAVKGNSSSEKTVKTKSLYTGLIECKVIAVNPSKSDLERMGINTEKEPQYVIEKDNGLKSVRVEFWVEAQISDAVKPISKDVFWIDSEIYVGKNSGKTQFINKYGKTGWGMSANECGEYFLTDGAREAYKGEEELHKFLFSYLNAKFDTKNKQYDECVIDAPKEFFSGNFSELKTIVNSFKENTVRLLWGVDANGYQTIYNKFSEKTCVSPNYKQWNTVLTGEYTQFKADFQENLAFQAYIPSTSVSTPKPDSEESKPKQVDVF